MEEGQRTNLAKTIIPFTNPPKETISFSRVSCPWIFRDFYCFVGLFCDFGSVQKDGGGLGGGMEAEAGGGSTNGNAYKQELETGRKRVISGKRDAAKFQQLDVKKSS